VRVQNSRDFPQTKLESEITSLSFLNEDGDNGDPRFFYQLFVKNSLIKNIFEEEKSLIVYKAAPYWVYILGEGEDVKLITELSEKVQYSHN